MKARLLALILLVGAASLAQAPRKDAKPLDKVQILALLAGGVPSQRLVNLVEQRGIGFEPTDDYLKILQGAGAKEVLLKALRSARPRPMPTVAQDIAARQNQIVRHLDRGIELLKKEHYREAKDEFHAALELDPDNGVLHFAMGGTLFAQKEWERAIAELREAIRLQPEVNDYATPHNILGLALSFKGDAQGAIGEFQTAIRLHPDDANAHNFLGLALANNGDFGGAITEYRAAIHLEPDDANPHNNLGLALANKGDLDGAIAEYEAAIRLQPNLASAHNALGAALQRKGKPDEAMAEYLTAIRLQPDLAIAHYNAANILSSKGDWDGALAEYRISVRLQPDMALAHQGLGAALSHMGDFQGALTELRKAYTLDPKNDRIRNDYETLLGSVDRR